MIHDPVSGPISAPAISARPYGLAIRMDGERILAIEGLTDPFSQGHLCPKAVALQDFHADPDRLRAPVRRTATGWQPIGWDEALDEVAEKLKRVQAEHGVNSAAIYRELLSHGPPRMNYIEMCEEESPIGNGMVESGAKQFKARFAGAQACAGHVQAPKTFTHSRCRLRWSF